MSRAKRRISLALQGGGAHGAFTWGVLDKLLEDGRFEVRAITGTSAGAMNAVALADGHYSGGNGGAREKLRALWNAVTDLSRLSPVKRTLSDIWLGNWSLDHSPSLAFFDMLSKFASPYDLNPLGLNPLRQIVAEVVDFERVRTPDVMKLFIAATNVQDGRVRVFRNREMSFDAIMASACLPFLFKAVEIDGKSYWDGGYAGNPVLFPYLYESDADDVILVQINPVERSQVPKTARDIANRVDEITFNSSLIRELRALAFISHLVAQGGKLPAGLRKLRVHRIDAGEGLHSITASSKLNAESGFVKYLFDAGRTAASSWLDRDGDFVGMKTSFDPLGDMPLLPEMSAKKNWRLFNRKAS